MTSDWIERLSLRGEQLTPYLARAYLPHLITSRCGTLALFQKCVR